MQAPGSELQEAFESAMRGICSQPMGDEGIAARRSRGLCRQGSHEGAQWQNALAPDVWSTCGHKGGWAHGGVQRCPDRPRTRPLLGDVGSEAETSEEPPPSPRNELAVPNLRRWHACSFNWSLSQSACESHCIGIAAGSSPLARGCDWHEQTKTPSSSGQNRTTEDAGDVGANSCEGTPCQTSGHQ